MASNYNRYPRPAMVIVADGDPFLAVERETVADLFSHERIRSTIGTIRQ
jgi:diaminopimelate decarboxylase